MKAAGSSRDHLRYITALVLGAALVGCGPRAGVWGGEPAASAADMPLDKVGLADLATSDGPVAATSGESIPGFSIADPGPLDGDVVTADVVVMGDDALPETVVNKLSQLAGLRALGGR